MSVNHVAVLVLGDIGRSPRMQYHCLSLATLPNTRVSLIGYRGERCVPSLEANSNIHKYYVPQPFASVSRKYFLLYAPIKVLLQILSILWLLLVTIPRPKAVLVQNPPSIPALACVWLACRLRGSKFVIDWHNFGYTILALSRGANSPLVNVSRVYEKFFGSKADGNLCVTNAMQQWLRANWNIRARVLHDKAPEFFHPCDLGERHELFHRLRNTFLPCEAGSAPLRSELTMFTQKLVGDAPTLLPNRPALLVSSTSWTPDEDFALLFDALVMYDERASSRQEYPSVVVVVTGKGPQRAMYEAKFQSVQLSKVVIKTIWLEASDYPLLLGSSDLGVCLHTSSSGLDLPMKVVDMFGCGLPVCAVGFQCLHELVQDGNNGLVFQDSRQLCDQLLQVLRGFPNSPQLTNLRAGVERSRGQRWAENWNERAAPLFVPNESTQ